MRGLLTTPTIRRLRSAEMGLVDINLVTQIGAAVAAVAGAAKSAYSGTIDKYLIRRLRKAEEAHNRTQEIEEKIDEIREHQEIQADALIQIGEMTGDLNGHNFDADLLREEVGRDEVDRFISNRDDQ